MNLDIHVRPAVAADIPQILEIEREAEAASHFAEADYQQALTSETSAARVLRRLLVVETSGRVQGFLVARFLHEEWEIENVAVAKAARRTGLGGSLVSSFLQSSTRSVGGKEESETRARAVLLEVREKFGTDVVDADHARRSLWGAHGKTAADSDRPARF